MIATAQIILEARRLVGVRFLHQGRSLEGGVDCLGLGIMAAQHAGLDVPAIALLSRDYGREATPRMLEDLTQACQRLRALVPGALLLFKMPRTAHPHHMGILTDTGTFIHADAVRAMTVIEQTYGRPWTRFLHSIWAVPGVEYPA